MITVSVGRITDPCPVPLTWYDLFSAAWPPLMWRMSGCRHPFSPEASLCLSVNTEALSLARLTLYYYSVHCPCTFCVRAGALEKLLHRVFMLSVVTNNQAIWVLCLMWLKPKLYCLCPRGLLSLRQTCNKCCVYRIDQNSKATTWKIISYINQFSWLTGAQKWTVAVIIINSY